MSLNGINSASSGISVLLLERNQALQSGASTADAGKGAGSGDFRATLTLRIAEMKSQTIGMLISSAQDSSSGQQSAGCDALFGAGDASASPLDAVLSAPGTSGGLSSSGRNTALFDPESAYRMMTDINTRDATYKAEFSEMSDMRSYLATMRTEAVKLGGIDSATQNSDIHASLQIFADAYNGWIQRFDQDLQRGGVLAGTQAAQVSQWELEQSVENFFNGAQSGLHGMRDLGLTIDPISNLASVDGAKLNSVLATNKSGAIGTMQEFSANFAKSAELLNSDGNFVPNRLNNLSRAINYIDTNKQSLQAEFGRGDSVIQTGQAAQALAKYNTTHALG